MWKYLKIDFTYYRTVLILVSAPYLILSVFIFGFAWSSASQDASGLLKLLGVFILFIWMIRLLRMLKERSDRFSMLLPVSSRQIGVSRILFGIIIWFIYLIIYTGLLLCFRSQEAESWIFISMISATGLWLILNAAAYIHRDLMQIFTGKYQILLLSGLYSVILLSAGLVFSAGSIERYFLELIPESMIKNMVWLMFIKDLISGSGLLNLMIGIMFSLAGMYLFTKRRAYLD